MGIIANVELPKKQTPYAEEVAELIKAGEGAGYELITPTEKSEDNKRAALTVRALFQTAAREAGYSARVVVQDEQDDGNTRFVFMLAPKRKSDKVNSATSDDKGTTGK